MMLASLLTSDLGSALLRSLAVALLALPIAGLLDQWLSRLPGRRRTFWLIVVLLPLLAPELLVGYGFASFELSLLHRPSWNQCLYLALLVLKFSPAGLLARLVMPAPAVSAEAEFCAKLVRRQGSRNRSESATVDSRGDPALAPLHSPLRSTEFRRSVWLRGSGMRHFVVAGVVFLLAFQEFEIASLMSIPSWTVSLFDAQAAGLQPIVTFRRLIAPVLIELLVLVPLVLCVWRRLGDATPRWRTVGHARGRRSSGEFVGLALVMAGLVALWGIPLFLIGRSGLNGVAGFVSNRTLLQSFFWDLLAAMLIASLAAFFAVQLSGLIVRRGRSTLLSRGSVLLGTLPGLCGAMVVSLSLLLLIQQPMLQGLRTTVLPVIVAMTVYLLPRAVLLSLLARAAQPDESMFLARLLNASPDPSQQRSGAALRWALAARWRFWIGTVVFYWGLFHLSATGILCPPTIDVFPVSMSVVPLPVRLYSLMHYGHNGPLSIMTLLSFTVPGILIAFLGTLLSRTSRC